MRRKLLSSILAILLVAAMLAGCGKTSGDDTAPPSDTSTSNTSSNDSPSPPPTTPDNPPELPAKDSILIGGSRPVSGVFAVFEQTGFGPVFRMWVDEVNAAGGIYVEEYGKQLPIETIIYDDGSDMATMIRLMEKLILEDEVDLLIPPCSTATLFAAAPLADQYGKLLIGAEGGSSTLRESAARYPRFFGPVNNSETQVSAMVNTLNELGVTSAYVVFIEDLFGTEYSGRAIPELTQAGIDVKAVKSVPPDVSDMTPIINDAKASGAQAFLLFAYPDQNFAAVGTAMALDYNPDVFLLGPGGNFDFFQYMFGGPQVIEGVTSFGAWNAKSSPAAAEYLDRYLAYIADNPNEPDASIDWWGHLCYYASLQMLQEAIEIAGTLDNDAIAEVLRTHEFETVMGTVWYEGNIMAAECFAGNMGQWQNGIFEVVEGAKRTADPIVKPAWPAH